MESSKRGRSSPLSDLDELYTEQKRQKLNNSKETSPTLVIAEVSDKKSPPRSQKKQRKGRLSGKARETHKARQSEKATEKSPAGLTLIDLPVEIWFEVFEYVDLLDLLRLTRTCKIFRRCLMRPSVSGVWKRARANGLDGLPECPPDMDEPSWASLAMDNFCHFCGAKAKRPTLWSVRLRLCRGCYDNPEYVRYFPSHSSLEWPFACLPESVIYNLDFYEAKCLVDDVADFKDTMASIGDDKAGVDSFISERTIEVEKTREFTTRCVVWENNYLYRVQTELRRARGKKIRKRRIDIEAKLVEIGYGTRLKRFKEMFPGRFGRHAYVGEGGELTEKEWKRIKGTLIELMDEEEKKRCQRKHDESIRLLGTLAEFEGKRVSRSMFKKVEQEVTIR